MMPETTQKIPFSQIVRQPVTYALVVIVSVFWGVFAWVTSRSDKSDDRCWEQVEQARKENESLRKENTDLYRSLLVSNGIIKQITKSDSTSKEDIK